MKLRPFFAYYGGKWRAAHHYPAPKFDMIIEPFAGAAGYSLHYSDRRVVLCEKDPKIAGIWRYLTRATEREVLRLPDWTEGTISDLGVSQEAGWLIGMCANPGSSHPRVSVPTNWIGADYAGSQKMCRWGAPIRERIASQVRYIRHWLVFEDDYSILPDDGEATWFIDPPYARKGVHYTHSSKAIDFERLGRWCRRRRGQTIVCENEGAEWLPFRKLADIKSSNKFGKSAEAIWYRERSYAG